MGWCAHSSSEGAASPSSVRGPPLRPRCGGLGEVCPPAHAVQPCSAALPPALTAAPRPVRVGGLCSHTERRSCVI